MSILHDIIIKEEKVRLPPGYTFKLIEHNTYPDYLKRLTARIDCNIQYNDKLDIDKKVLETLVKEKLIYFIYKDVHKNIKNILDNVMQLKLRIQSIPDYKIPYYDKVEKHINDILSDIEEMNQISRGKK